LRLGDRPDNEQLIIIVSANKSIKTVGTCCAENNSAKHRSGQCRRMADRSKRWSWILLIDRVIITAKALQLGTLNVTSVV